MCVQCVFCRKSNSQQLLFEAFFDIVGIFGHVEPKSESTFPFQYIIFQTYQSLESLAPLLGEIDIICVTNFFVGNIILNIFI